MNRRTWLTSWLKLSNLITLGLLMISAFGAFQLRKDSNNTLNKNSQTVTATEECNVDILGEKANSANLQQKVMCSGGSHIKNITQE